jgi:hypothetical protein
VSGGGKKPPEAKRRPKESLKIPDLVDPANKELEREVTK